DAGDAFSPSLWYSGARAPFVPSPPVLARALKCPSTREKASRGSLASPLARAQGIFRGRSGDAPAILGTLLGTLLSTITLVLSGPFLSNCTSTPTSRSPTAARRSFPDSACPALGHFLSCFSASAVMYERRARRSVAVPSQLWSLSVTMNLRTATATESA